MQGSPSALVAGLFTAHFRPARAEALASEIRLMARKLGADTFTATLAAITNGHRPRDVGIGEKTLMLMMERMFDRRGDAATARTFAGQLQQVLAPVPPEVLHATFDDVCRRLLAAAPKPTREATGEVKWIRAGV